jgi:NTE family protein
LILAGAVAKGDFEAGVLSVIAKRPIAVTSIVATSAGALNGAIYAAGLRVGKTEFAAKIINELWWERASWAGIVRPSLRGIFGGRGLSSISALEEVLSDGIERVVEGATGPRAPISLDFVTTSLKGTTRATGQGDATTFEHVIHLGAEHFDSEAGRKAICQAALASAAFPFLFVPVELPGVGSCIDGGLVNNAPISHAIDAGVDRVIVVTGNPVQAAGEARFRGADLAGQAADIGVNERLFRDLLQARRVNAKLEKVDRVLTNRNADPALRRELAEALGWKPLEIIEIRPERTLEGNAFSALGKPQLRADYIHQGVSAAEKVLAKLDRRSGVTLTGS